MTHPRLCGLVLAAGAGTRFGGPKALARTPDGTPWVQQASRMLRAGGCSQVIVALGAGAAQARSLVPRDATILIVQDWAEGLGTTVRAGLVAAVADDADAVVVTPVDTPDAPSAAVRRVLKAAVAAGLRSSLAQAVYGERPGHPVLIGAERVAEMLPELRGDSGARAVLAARGALEVDCSDLWSGVDVDRR